MSGGLVSAVHPVAGQWIQGTSSTDYGSIAAGATETTFAIPVRFGGAGFTIFARIDSTSVATDCGITAYAYASGDKTALTSYATISPVIAANPTTLTTSWVAYDFSPPATEYIAVSVVNADGANALRPYILFKSGG